MLCDVLPWSQVTQHSLNPQRLLTQPYFTTCYLRNNLSAAILFCDELRDTISLTCF
jgi:hypothetical protein